VVNSYLRQFDIIWKTVCRRYAPQYTTLEQFPKYPTVNSWKEAWQFYISRYWNKVYIDPKPHNQTKRTVLKIAIVGESGVGKTSIVRRVTVRSFNKIVQEIFRADFLPRRYIVQNKLFVLELWDRSGQDRILLYTKRTYYQGTDVVFFVYDVSNTTTLDTFEDWMNYLHEKGVEVGTPIVIVGNKIDLKKDPTIDERISTLQKTNPESLFFETSAKEDININEVFYECCQHNWNVESLEAKEPPTVLSSQASRTTSNYCW